MFIPGFPYLGHVLHYDNVFMQHLEINIMGSLITLHTTACDL